MSWKAENFETHPEGGRFREVYRSQVTVNREGAADRSACTHIYFNLKKGEISTFHKVTQEEIWNLYQGALTLWIYDEETDQLEQLDLSSESNTFCAVVPAGCWQAAEPASEEVLVGCTVAPGFEFEDFELIKTDSTVAKTLLDLGLERFL